MKIEELRDKHRRFVYERVQVERLRDTLKITFHFLLEPDIEFKPHIVIESINQSRIDSLNDEIIDLLFFNLGLVEMLSYWKAAGSPTIIIKAGYLNDEQVDWWEDLLLYGMREYFFINQIDYRQPDFIEIIPEANQKQTLPRYVNDAPSHRNLVLTSGGKDTALTLQILLEANQAFDCLMLNPAQAALDLASAANSNPPIIVRRTIDPTLLKLNEMGYLNGHTPFSAYLAFLGVACAILFKYSQVVVSNERSSDESNVFYLDNEVNHQYSKTYRFEKKFQHYVEKYVASNTYYFSLLRPLYELQIARLLTDYPKWLTLFRSCNRNQRDNTWCGKCPKCISVFVLVYPFLQDEAVVRLFGTDLFKNEESIPLLNELTGFTGHKPFECVGTAEETLAALYLGLKKAKNREAPLSATWHYVEDKILRLNPQGMEAVGKTLLGWNQCHTLPTEYEFLLKKHLRKIDEPNA